MAEGAVDFLEKDGPITKGPKRDHNFHSQLCLYLYLHLYRYLFMEVPPTLVQAGETRSSWRPRDDLRLQSHL